MKNTLLRVWENHYQKQEFQEVYINDQLGGIFLQF